LGKKSPWISPKGLYEDADAEQERRVASQNVGHKCHSCVAGLPGPVFIPVPKNFHSLRETSARLPGNLDIYPADCSHAVIAGWCTRLRTLRSISGPELLAGFGRRIFFKYQVKVLKLLS